MSRPFHFRLSHKIMSIGVVGLIGIGVIAIIGQTGDRYQDDSLKVTGDVNALSELSRRVSMEMLDTRRAEKNFQLRRDVTYATRQRELADMTNGDFEKLKAAAEAGKLPEVAEQIAKAQMSFRAYNTEFASLVQSEIAVGLDENSGLSGSLRAAVHDIEDKLKAIDNPRLTSVMLMMRRHEKDFMLRRNAKYIGEFNNTVAEFSRWLVDVDVDAPTKAEIRRQLVTYQKEFTA